MSTNTNNTRRGGTRSNSTRVTSEGKFTQKDKASYPRNSWVVFVNSNTGRKAGMITYDGRFTRDEVRTAYAQEFGVHQNETRSRRVRNF